MLLLPSLLDKTLPEFIFFACFQSLWPCPERNSGKSFKAISKSFLLDGWWRVLFFSSEMCKQALMSVERWRKVSLCSEVVSFSKACAVPCTLLASLLQLARGWVRLIEFSADSNSTRLAVCRLVRRQCLIFFKNHNPQK